MWCRPESTDYITRGGAEVNIGIIKLTSHQLQCLYSQQLFNYIMFLSKKVLAMDHVLDSLEFLFLHDHLLLSFS